MGVAGWALHPLQMRIQSSTGLQKSCNATSCAILTRTFCRHQAMFPISTTLRSPALTPARLAQHVRLPVVVSGAYVRQPKPEDIQQTTEVRAMALYKCQSPPTVPAILHVI